MIHECRVRGRAVCVRDPDVVAGGVASDWLDASFDSEWVGLDVACVFERDGADPLAVSVPEGGLVEIPWEAISEPGALWVGFRGQLGGETVVLTERMERPMRVVPNGAPVGSEPSDPTGSWYATTDWVEGAIADAVGAIEATTDYEELENLPSINGVTVSGEAESLERYGAKPIGDDIIESICV